MERDRAGKLSGAQIVKNVCCYEEFRLCPANVTKT